MGRKFIDFWDVFTKIFIMKALLKSIRVHFAPAEIAITL